MAIKQPRPQSIKSILQLHIELKGTRPKVWRRVLVPDTIKLELLHVVILRAFGWSGGHLHEFVTSEGDRYGSSDPLDEMPGVASGANIKLTTVLRTATLQYIYDFGDCWEHRIQVEKTHAPDSVLRLPMCVGGACATPPDDCGGVPGYAHFVRVMADPNDPEHDDLAEWIGRDSWDPKAIDFDEINERLAEIKV
jgi:Plasmid pRiA4b ORF-3-like protein